MDKTEKCDTHPTLFDQLMLNCEAMGIKEIKRIRWWVPTACMFALLALLLLLGELMDIPHLLFGAAATPFNWQEVAIELFFVALVAVFVVLKILHDISSLRKTEEALKQSENRYRTLFHESRNAIYMSTRDGRFIDVNQSTVNLFGFSRGELLETLNIRGATFLNNLSPKGDGGAIFNDRGAVLDAANATFSANGATDGDGGAIYNSNTQQGSTIASHATFRNVTFSTNLEGNDGTTFFNQDGAHTIALGNTIIDDGGSLVAVSGR